MGLFHSGFSSGKEIDHPGSEEFQDEFHYLVYHISTKNGGGISIPIATLSYGGQRWPLEPRF